MSRILSMVTGIPRVGDGIETAGMPGMAARQSAQGQEAATQCTEAINSFDGILRATGIEAAMIAEEGAYHELVSADEQFSKPAHSSSRSFVQSLCSECCRSALFALLDAGLHMITMSIGQVRQSQVRKLSRTRRLMRFRPTAVAAHLREIARPSRACDGLNPGCTSLSVSPSATCCVRTNRVKKRSEDLVGLANTRLYCVARVSRWRREKPSNDNDTWCTSLGELGYTCNKPVFRCTEITSDWAHIRLGSCRAGLGLLRHALAIRIGWAAGLVESHNCLPWRLQLGREISSSIQLSDKSNLRADPALGC